jgi:hypothetical protein
MGTMTVRGFLGLDSIALTCLLTFTLTGIDLAALTLLSHLPPLYLLSSFYSISPISAGISLVIDISTTYLPFRLLRPLSTIHTPSSSPTRTIIDDMTVRLWTTLLATSIYGSIFYISYRTFLPSFLITHFEGLVTLSTAYETSLPILLASMVPVGYAVREFIFSPSTAAAAAAESAASGKSSASSPAFNPVTATLGETVLHNVWGYNRHTKVTLQRTATLVGLVLGNTWLQGTLTVAGIDPVGAAGWAGLWAGAGLASGAVFWWVGNV